MEEAPAEERMRTLDLGLDIVNGVGRLHLEGDSLARKGLHENLHDGDLDSGVVVVPVSYTHLTLPTKRIV